MALSMVDTEIETDYTALNVTIVGAPGTGKTNLASKLGEPGTIYFAATEFGHKYVKVRKTPVNKWSDFEGIVKDFISTKHPYKHLVIDVFDKLVDMAEDEICSRNKVTKISDLPYGSGYKATKGLIIDSIDLLNAKGFGVTMIVHDKIGEIKKENISYTAVRSSLSESVERAVFGASDLVLYCYIDKDGKYMIRAKPSKYIVCAKDRSAKLPEVFANDAQLLMKYLKG